MTSLKGKSILLTGGGSGIGEGIAQAMEYLINAGFTTGAVLDVDGGMGLGATSL